MSEKLAVRRSARLIIVDAQGSLLLFRYHDEHQAPFWATVGGELLDGEDYKTTASRELWEETGVKIPIGKMLRERDEVYAVARSGPDRWLERYFLVECEEEFRPLAKNWTDEERVTIQDWKWWSLHDMQSSGEVFLPSWLKSLLGDILKARRSSCFLPLEAPHEKE